MNIVFFSVISFFNDNRELTGKNILVLLSKMIINALFHETADIQLPKLRFEEKLKLGQYLSQKLFVLFTVNFVRLRFGSLL